MSTNIVSVLYLLSALLFIFSLRGLSHPESSRLGNIFGIIGMFIAIFTTLMFKNVLSYTEIGVAVLTGGTIGTLIALKIKMTALPQLVAAFHSLVGLAAVFVAASAYYNPSAFNIGSVGSIPMGSLIEMSIGTAIGAVTLSLLSLNANNLNDLGIFAIPIILLIGSLLGCINGLLHVYLKIPSFMVTLGFSFVGIGVATIMIGGITVRVLDKSLRSLALERFLNFSYVAWIGLFAWVIALIFQNKTKFGTYMYAIGGGEDIAKLSGIPINLTKVVLFSIAGFYYSLGGIFSALQLGQGNALIGSGRLFTAITAVVVGGTALSGGVGGVQNTFIGVLIVVVLSNGLILMGIPPFYQQGVQGLIIVVAIALSLNRKTIRIIK